MPGFNVREFRSVIDRNDGITRPSHFLVQFPVPKSLQGFLPMNNSRNTNITFYCKAANIPGLGILSSDIYRYGYGPIERKPYGLVYNDIMVQMYVDGKNVVRTWFNYWTRMVINHRADKGMNSQNPMNGAGAFEHSYKEDYMVDVTISAFNNLGKETSRVTLTEAYPNYVDDLRLDWDAKNEHLIMPVSLTYRDWYDEAVTGRISNGLFGLDTFISEIGQAVEGVENLLFEVTRATDVVNSVIDIGNDTVNTARDVTNSFRFL